MTEIEEFDKQIGEEYTGSILQDIDNAITDIAYENSNLVAEQIVLSSKSKEEAIARDILLLLGKDI